MWPTSRSPSRSGSGGGRPDGGRPGVPGPGSRPRHLEWWGDRHVVDAYFGRDDVLVGACLAEICGGRRRLVDYLPDWWGRIGARLGL